MSLPSTPQTIQVGAYAATVIPMAFLQLSEQEMDDPEVGQDAANRPASATPLIMPVQGVLVQTGTAKILVDVCAADSIKGTEYEIPGAQQPPDVVAQLASLGVSPTDITHVVITHAHFDHYSGVTSEGHPVFPNARYLLGKADWESAYLQDELAKPDSLEFHTLGALMAQGRLDLIEGDSEIVPGVRIVATPGETPGHQIVRVEDEGQVLYVLGDLYHHVSEVSHPERMAQWADAITNRATRDHFATAALNEEAKLVAAHIPGIGCFGRTDAGVRWEEIA